MIARLAGRDAAVVAGLASAIYLRVIDAYHRLPSEHRVAGLALHGARNVARRLALGGNAVMTGRAAALHLAVIELARQIPSHSRVAGIALAGTQHVILWLDGRRNPRAAAMAGSAIARRTLEDGADMARLAGDVQVRVEQLVAGGQVIELGRAYLTGARAARERQQQCRHRQQVGSLFHGATEFSAQRS